MNPARKDSHGPCPGYRLALSQDRWDKGDAEKLKVDGALHLQSELPSNDGRPHWESQRVLFEFKKGGGLSAMKKMVTKTSVSRVD